MLCDGLSPEAQSGSLPVDHHAKINASDIQGAEAQSGLSVSSARGNPS